MELCRLCYTETPLHFYRTIFNLETEPPLLEMITKLTNLNICKDDPYPKVMCLNCYDKLMNFHDFLQVIVETDTKFRKKLNDNPNFIQLADIKKETDWETANNQLNETEIKNEITETTDHELETDDGALNESSSTTEDDPSKICTIKGYNCTFCWKIFKYNSYLKRHLKVHEKLYKCDICNKDLPLLSDLHEHKKLHTQERPYQCNICKKRFPFKAYLTKHSKTHSNIKPYKCDICNREFLRTYNLNKHKELHNGDKVYKCETCNETFLQFSDLNNHKQVHSEKLYQCNVCMKKFIFQGNLIRHSKIHSGKKSHKCNVCGKRFIQKCSLTRHYKLHEPIKQEMVEKPFVLM